MSMSLIQRFNIGVRKSFAILNQGLELNDSLYDIQQTHLPMLLNLQPPSVFFTKEPLSNDFCCIFHESFIDCPLNDQCLLKTLDFNELTYSAESIYEFLKELSTARKSFDIAQLKLVDKQCFSVLTDLFCLESLLSYLSLSNSIDQALDKQAFILMLIDILMANFELLNSMLKWPKSITKINDSNDPLYVRVNQVPNDTTDGDADFNQLIEDHLKSLDFLKSATSDGKILYQFLDQSRHPSVIIYNDKSINLYNELNHIKYQSILLLQTLYSYSDVNWAIYNSNISLVYPVYPDEYFYYDRLAKLFTPDKLKYLNERCKSHTNSIDMQFIVEDYSSTTLVPLLQLDISFLIGEVVCLLLQYANNSEILDILLKHNIAKYLITIINQENGAYIASIISKLSPMNIENLTKFKYEIEDSLKISISSKHSILLLLMLCNRSKGSYTNEICRFVTDYLSVYSFECINRIIQKSDFSTTHLPLISKCLNTISDKCESLSLQQISVELLYILNKFKPYSTDLSSYEIKMFYSSLCQFLWKQNLNLSNALTPCTLLKNIELPPSILESKSKIIYDKYKSDDLTIFNLIYMLSISNNAQSIMTQILLEKLICDEILVNKYWGILTSATSIHSIQNWLQDILSNINDDKYVEQISIISNLISILLVPKFDLSKLQLTFGSFGNLLQAFGDLLKSILEMCDFHNGKYSNPIKSILLMYLRLLFLIKYYKPNNLNLLQFLSWKSVITIMSLKEISPDYTIPSGICSMIFGLACEICQVNRFHELGIDAANSISDYPNSLNNLLNSNEYITKFDELEFKCENKFPMEQLNACKKPIYLWNNYDLTKLIICATVYKTFVHEKAMNVLLDLVQQNQISQQLQPHLTSLNATRTPNALLNQLNNASTEQQDNTKEIAHLYSTISKLNRQMAVLAKAYFQADDSLRKAKYDLEQLKVPRTPDHQLQIKYEELKFKHEKLLELLGRIEEQFPEAVAICKSKIK